MTEIPIYVTEFSPTERNDKGELTEYTQVNPEFIRENPQEYFSETRFLRWLWNRKPNEVIGARGFSGSVIESWLQSRGLRSVRVDYRNILVRAGMTWWKLEDQLVTVRTPSWMIKYMEPIGNSNGLTIREYVPMVGANMFSEMMSSVEGKDS